MKNQSVDKQTSRAASLLGKRSAGKPKHYTPEEIARRTARIRAAKRWPKVEAWPAPRLWCDVCRKEVTSPHPHPMRKMGVGKSRTKTAPNS